MSPDLHSLLRIFTHEMAMHGDRAVLEVLVEEAKSSQLLGLTVIRGRLGFGHTRIVHASHLLDHNRPLIVEIIDHDARLRAFAEKIQNMPGLGLITIVSTELLLGARVTAP